MTKKLILIISLALNVLLILILTSDEDVREKSSSPPDLFYPQTFGPVPDSFTAIETAKKAWLPLYGKRVLKEEPFIAKLEVDTFWRMRGSLPKGPEGSITLGGVAHATIRKSDGKLMNVMHGK